MLAGLPMWTKVPVYCATHHRRLFTHRFRNNLLESVHFWYCLILFLQSNLEFLPTKREGEREPQVSAR
jgi:hypothetical protein